MLSLLSAFGGGPSPSPFATPKKPSKFPPRPPSSHSNRWDLNNAGMHSHSIGERTVPAPGCRLMGTMAMAALCYRTLEAAGGRGKMGGR